MYTLIIRHHGLNKSANCAGKKNIYARFDFIDLHLTGCVVCICCINSNTVNPTVGEIRIFLPKREETLIKVR